MNVIATPLSAADLIPGPLYIWMHVHHNGVLMVGLFSVLSESNKQGKIGIEYLHGTNRYHMNVTYADLGCLSGATPVLENYNRVFYAEDYLYERLHHLTFYQNLTAWLAYLAIPEPELVAAALVAPKTAVVRPLYPPDRNLAFVPAFETDVVFEADYADIQLPRAQQSPTSAFEDKWDRISQYRESRRMQ